MDVSATTRQLVVPPLNSNTDKPRNGFFKTAIVWQNVIGFLLLHIAAVYGAYLYIYEASWATKLFGIACYWLSAKGTTMGAHRLYSHRTYKATLPLRLIIMFLSTLAGQNSLWVWVRDHRVHHKYSDTDADPHNSTRGLFFSHIGWLLLRKHPDVAEKGRKLDMSDLNADPLVMFQKRYYYQLYIACNSLLMLVPVFAWKETLWNSFMVTWLLRTTLLYHATWSINSFAHWGGTKPYDEKIRAAEEKWTALFSGGEGWHNYHHTFPMDYKASEYGMPFNSTKGVIDLFAKLGWAYDLKEASGDAVFSRVERTGDGTRKFVWWG